eukprot:365740-Chlamydomonas_euryale.AAC.5
MAGRILRHRYSTMNKATADQFHRIACGESHGHVHGQYGPLSCTMTATRDSCMITERSLYWVRFMGAAAGLGGLVTFVTPHS